MALHAKTVGWESLEFMSHLQQLAVPGLKDEQESFQQQMAALPCLTCMHTLGPLEQGK